MLDEFHRLAAAITRAMGAPWALLVAFASIVIWGLSGPMFGFSDTWQLAINTATTIVTFLMVFVIQSTQNREARVTQLKLDELIRAVEGARNQMIALEDSSEDRVEEHAKQFRHLAASAEPDESLDELEQARVAAAGTNRGAGTSARTSGKGSAANGTTRKTPTTGTRSASRKSSTS